MKRDRSEEENEVEAGPGKHYKESWIAGLPPDLMEKVLLEITDYYAFYTLTRSNTRIRDFMQNRNLLEKWFSIHIGPDSEYRRWALMTTIPTRIMSGEEYSFGFPYKRNLRHIARSYIYISYKSGNIHVNIFDGLTNYEQLVQELMDIFKHFNISRTRVGENIDLCIKNVECLKFMYILLKSNYPVVEFDDLLYDNIQTFTNGERRWYEQLSKTGTQSFKPKTYNDYLAIFACLRERSFKLKKTLWFNTKVYDKTFEKCVTVMYYLAQGDKIILNSNLLLGDMCQTCINGGLTPGKARIMLHEGRANGRPLTDKQRRFFACRAHGGCAYGAAESSAQGVIDLLNRRTRGATRQALDMLQNMFMDGQHVDLEFSDCLDKDDSVVYPGFKTGYANGSRIHICTDALGDGFNAQHSKTISYDSAHVSHFCAMFLHEFGHVLDKNSIEWDTWYGGATNVERRADAFAQWFINKSV